MLGCILDFLGLIYICINNWAKNTLPICELSSCLICIGKSVIDSVDESSSDIISASLSKKLNIYLKRERY